MEDPVPQECVYLNLMTLMTDTTFSQRNLTGQPLFKQINSQNFWCWFPYISQEAHNIQEQAMYKTEL